MAHGERCGERCWKGGQWMRRPVYATLSLTSCSEQLDIREFTLCKGLGEAELDPAESARSWQR